MHDSQYQNHVWFLKHTCKVSFLRIPESHCLPTFLSVVFHSQDSHGHTLPENASDLNHGTQPGIKKHENENKRIKSGSSKTYRGKNVQFMVGEKKDNH